MTTISIIGSGNMASAIGTRAAQTRPHRRDHEPRRRQGAGARRPDRRGRHASARTAQRPAGDIVVVAVLYAGAVDVVAHYGDALAGKILVDITNPFNADATGLVTTAGNSMSQQIAAAAPEGTHVVKAFNTIFQRRPRRGQAGGRVLRRRRRRGEGRVAAFLESLGMRPLDAGGLEMAYALEWAGILLVGLARNGAGFDIALGARAV